MRKNTKVFVMLSLLAGAIFSANATNPVYVIPNVYGDGEQIDAVAIEYPNSIAKDSISLDSFEVPNHKIISAYTSTEPQVTSHHSDGKYVVLDLENKNSESPITLQKNNNDNSEAKADNKMTAPMHSDRKAPTLAATVLQVKPIKGVDGTIYQPSKEWLKSEHVTSSVIDKFKVQTYTDKETKSSITYNIYLPENYNPQQKYPLLFFIADASANNNDDRTPLYQGNGATVWATEQEQRKHQAIIVAPQYTDKLVNSLGMLTTDDYVWTPGLTLMTNLLRNIISTYPVDTDRIYGVGQSQGGMANIAISDKYPDLFAAQYLVASQWNPNEMQVLKHNKLWILVSEGDSKAYPTMNETVYKWQQAGIRVAKPGYTWNSLADADTFAKYVADVEQQQANINYTVLKDGSHNYTWSVAYNIEGIRDWLFQQTKSGKNVKQTVSGKYESKRQMQYGLEDEAHQYTELGKNYLFGENGVAKDYAKALAAFTRADKQGDKKAARYLGLMNLNGWGTKPNNTKAFTNFTKAANNGDITGMYYLGRCYEEGVGVTRSYSMAYHWYKKAAQRGDLIAAPGMVGMGRLYENGLGVNQNLRLSQELYEKAVRAGYEEAKEDLQRLRIANKLK